jgi:hypothetical protein
MIHARYRWPRFTQGAGASAWFDAIADSELKAVLSGAAPARFEGYRLAPRLAEWRNAFLAWPLPPDPTRRDIIAAYIDSWFSLGEDKPIASRVLGHCPSLVLDAEAIFVDFPDAKIVHVVRDPTAGLGDFRRRHGNFPTDDFATRWTLVNGAALRARTAHPHAVLIVQYERLRDTREFELRRVLDFLGLPFEPATLTPSWRGRPVSDHGLGPFGGVGAIGAAHDADMVSRISDHEQAQLRATTQQLLEECRRAARTGGQAV